MKAKETRKSSRMVHDLAFKRRVIDDLLLTGDSLSSIGERYGVTSRSIYNWLRIFGITPPKNEIISTMAKEHKDRELQQENIELKREIARLKAALFHAEAEALAQKTLLKQVTTRYHIEVKKKTDLQR